jgi:hypothetical protein
MRLIPGIDIGAKKKILAVNIRLHVYRCNDLLDLHPHAAKTGRERVTTF